ncbi:MAG TPA: hypothetical protein PKW33_15760 [Anaerolineaceae bacterium]|nr:hypothetical protein [Anaerolineaceae bacterium]HPN53052.1 hypothetical protein [Anaerolineaceae bacterium]
MKRSWIRLAGTMLILVMLAGTAASTVRGEDVRFRFEHVMKMDFPKWKKAS